MYTHTHAYAHTRTYACITYVNVRLLVLIKSLLRSCMSYVIVSLCVCALADRKRSSFYIGAAVMPLDPDEGFAKYLQTSAWMLSDSGILFQTQQGTSRNPLRDRLMPSPDGGHTVELTIPSLGTAMFTAKNKYRKHRYAFKDGSLIKMELDRDSRTLRFCVDNKQWVTLTGVSNYARPFLNFFTAGDGATLLQAEDGRSIASDLI